MFVDVRNFTEISERLPPTAVVGFLNTLLDALSRHVIANEGTLDKFIGDSIMAFWNAPVDVADHAEQGGARGTCHARDACAIQRADAFGFGKDQQVGIGIGIHTGLACVGNMGAETRFNYSAVGDAVNVAARIEASCKEVGFDILDLGETARQLNAALLDAGTIGLKGKSDRTRLFAVVGDEPLAKSPEFAELEHLHGQLVEALRVRSPQARRIVGTIRHKLTSDDTCSCGILSADIPPGGSLP